jgi:hypothetical protein
MSAVLKGIDAEWRQLARSPQARRALMRWKAKHAVFEDMADFDALLAHRQEEPGRAPEILAALAALAPTDELAARVLLQALVPGLIHLSRTAGYDDREALNEMIGLAWERIATYPTTRHGAVAANVLLDVRKRYRQLRELDRPRKLHHRDAVADPRRASSDDAITERVASEPSAEDAAMQFLVLDELVAAQQEGVISESGLGVIVQTRVLDRTVSDVAAECGKSRNTLMSWRFRAERRLRETLLAG